MNVRCDSVPRDLTEAKFLHQHGTLLQSSDWLQAVS